MRQAFRGGWWIAILVAAGCTKSAETIDPEVLGAHRARLLLDEEPDGAVGVLDVREMLVGPANPTESQEGDAAKSSSQSPESSIDTSGERPASAPEMVVLVGRIGGIPNPWKGLQPDYPWTAGQAQFVIADPAAAAEIEDHGHAHDDPDHECPFCAAASGSDAVAVVRFKGEDGKILRIDARELFKLQGEETVVVHGKPQMLGEGKDGVLLVDAYGLYVRR